MRMLPSKSFERNSRLSVAMVKNRAEQNYLGIELNHIEKEKKTTLRMLQNDKQCFKLKYSKNNENGASGRSRSDEVLSKYFIPSSTASESFVTSSIGDSQSKSSVVDFEEIHNMLFTNNEIDKEKILCLHLISAHRTESLAPPKRKLAHMCKIHSPLERLLERSKRKHIHHEQKMTSMLPIYTIEVNEFGSQEDRDLINDGRLATRILLNEKVRELINTVLNALRQSNPEKNTEIFEMANDISALKQLFTKRKILDFLDDMINSSLINSSESFVLTAPFRVKSVQLEIRTLSGTLEAIVKQIRQNVLQLPTRADLKSITGDTGEEISGGTIRPSFSGRVLKKMARKASDEDNMRETSKVLEGLYSDRQRRESDPEKKVGIRVDTNFVQKNIEEAGKAKKIEYESDDDSSSMNRRRSSQSSNRSRRRSSEPVSILDRPHIQPLRISEEVAAIMEGKDKEPTVVTAEKTKLEEDRAELNKLKDLFQDPKYPRRRTSSNDPVRIHLKQTTCPACMERYKIPLPTPKTPRIKPSSVIPLAPGENPNLKTNSKNRISMLINKEMFKLESYERRFSSDESSRRNSLKGRELEACSSSYLHLSPLELAKIEQEIKEKETQKKLEKFLQQ